MGKSNYVLTTYYNWLFEEDFCEGMQGTINRSYD